MLSRREIHTMATKTSVDIRIAEILKKVWALDEKGQFESEGVNLVREMLQISQEQTESTVQSLESITRQYADLAEKYYDLAKKYADTPELLFAAFSLDPAGTLETLLKDVERKKKIEDQSGDAWMRSYVITLWHRIKIAWRLIFRPRFEEVS
jgi:hypothetical protein